MRDQEGFSQGNYKSTFKQENQWRKKNTKYHIIIDSIIGY